MRRAMYKALQTKGIHDPPILFPFEVAEGTNSFTSKPKILFTMLKMDGDISKLNFVEVDGKRLRGGLCREELNLTIAFLKDQGFILGDLEKDRNIFYKNQRVYIGDCGTCGIKPKTNAHNILMETTDELVIHNFHFDEKTKKAVFDWILE